MISPNLQLRTNKIRPFKLVFGVVVIACLVPPLMQLRGAYRHAVALRETEATNTEELASVTAKGRIVSLEDEQGRDLINEVPVRLSGYNCRTQELPSDKHLISTLTPVRPSVGERTINDNEGTPIGTINAQGHITLDISHCRG